MSSARCGGKTRTPDKKGKPCARPAGWGTPHPGYGKCKFHGGSTKNGRKAAKKEWVDTQIAMYGDVVEIEPEQALIEELWRTNGAVRYLASFLTDGEVDEVHSRLKQTVKGPGNATHEGLSVEAELYMKERQHLLHVTKTAIAAGLATRQVEIAEQQAAMLVAVIRGVLDDLGMGDDPRVPKVVQRRLLEASAMPELTEKASA